MKIYYFSKSIVRKSLYQKYFCGYGTGRENEYTSKEELIKGFEKMLGFVMTVGKDRHYAENR